MKKVLILIAVATLCLGTANSQVKRTAVKRTSTNVAAKAKAGAEAKRQELNNNSKCKFKFGTEEFVSCQNNESYVIYEIPDMTASELKSAAYTALSSMFKSILDVISSPSDDIIELEASSPCLWEGETEIFHKKIFNYVIFKLVIQFKDDQVRYNAPTLKNYYISIENSKGEEMIDISNVNKRKLFNEDELKKIEDYFNNLIASVNSKLKNSNGR